MNQNVYDTLNSAREKLFDMQTSHIGADYKAELDVVAMALDEGMDELDRLAAWIKRLEKPQFKGREHYLEFHESRDELQFKIKN